MMNLEQARFNMVEQQIRPWDVLDQTVLDTFRFLPREKFVPYGWQKLAFADIEIPLGYGETMMHPRIEARMLQELAIRPTDQCLEIGTGSGFVTACLSQLGQQVDSVEIRREFSQQAEIVLNELAISNVNLYVDDAKDGWHGMPGKQYDVIAITGSVPEYITDFETRLAPGGRLFIVVGREPAMHALLITRELDLEGNPTGEWLRRSVFETHLNPLVGTERAAEFQF